MASGERQYPTPNARYPHLFVVVRVDEGLPVERAEDQISLVSAYSTEDEARAEAERLTELITDKPSRYAVMITRLKAGRPADDLS